MCQLQQLPRQLVISGEEPAIDAACRKGSCSRSQAVQQFGLNFNGVGWAFHSFCMEPARAELGGEQTLFTTLARYQNPVPYRGLDTTPLKSKETAKGLFPAHRYRVLHLYSFRTW